MSEQLPKFSMKLDWKDGISVSLDAMETWFKANAGAEYRGNSADDKGLTLWFAEVPSEEEQEAVQAKWDAIDEDSAEVEAYVPMEDIQAAKAAKKASAIAKLADLGLTQDELKALLG